MPATVYWFIVCLGFLVVVGIFYLQRTGLEAFEATSGTSGTTGTSATSGTSGTTGTSATSGTTGTTGTTGTSATSGTSGTTGTTGTSATSGTSGTTGTSATSGTTGSNALAVMPQLMQLLLFMASFDTPSTYQCSSNYWCDSTRENTKYFLMANSLPKSITAADGLPMQSILMRGPPAYTLAPGSQYLLESFTLAFYAKIHDIVFDPANLKDVVLLDIPCQTPDRVKIFFAPVAGNENQVKVCVKLGSITTNDIFVWTFEKATLRGANRLFAFVYDHVQKRLRMYVGKEEQAPVMEVAPETRIVLSVSEITFNQGQNWNASLVAFTYHTAPLAPSEIATLDTYFMQQSSGYAAEVRARLLLESQMANLVGNLQARQSRILDLMGKIRSCPAPAADAGAMGAAPAQPKWQITLGQGGSGISASDLGKCSPLTVKQFGGTVDADVTPNAPSSTPTTTAAASSPASTSSPTSSKERYKVPYPPNVTSSTVSKDPNAGTAAKTDTTAKTETKPKQTTVEDHRNLWDVLLQPAKEDTDVGKSSTTTQSSGFWDNLKNLFME